MRISLFRNKGASHFKNVSTKVLTLTLSLMVFVLPAPGFSQPAPTRIGEIETAHHFVKGTDADGKKRNLLTGDPVHRNEVIATGRDSYARIVLLDGTRVTLSEKSELVLDEFIYDPRTDAGEIAASVTQGVFRFVTGKVAGRDEERVKVHMATGTIGIRGTAVIGETSKKQSRVILEKKSENEIKGPHVFVRSAQNAPEAETPLTFEGAASDIKKDMPPGPEYRIPENDLKKLQAALEQPEEETPFDAFDSVGFGSHREGIRDRGGDEEGEPSHDQHPS